MPRCVWFRLSGPVWGGGGTWEEEWHRPPNTEAREEEAPVRLVPAIEAGMGWRWHREEEWHRPPNTEAREEEAPVRLVPAIEAGMRSRRQPGRRMGACRCYTEGQGGGGPAVQLGPVW